jgi:hypothetical protein
VLQETKECKISGTTLGITWDKRAGTGLQKKAVQLHHVYQKEGKGFQRRELWGQETWIAWPNLYLVVADFHGVLHDKVTIKDILHFIMETKIIACIAKVNWQMKEV